MGLDIIFSKKAAIEAGIQTRLLPNATDKEVARAIAEGMSENYIKWLGRTAEHIRVEGMDDRGIPFWVDWGDEPETAVVRANKWGDIYLPLTSWLFANNIEWEEWS